MKALIQLALDAVITMDGHGRITDWNPQAELTFGWSREEAVGRVLSDTIIPSRYREAHERGLRNFLETGEGPILNKRLEIEALHRDGHEFPVELAISAVRSDSGWTFAAFVRETTPRKRVEEALAEETEVLYLLMDNTQDSIYFKDVAGRFTRINRAQARALGIADTKQALGKTEFDFLSADCAQAAFEDEQQVIQTGRPLVGKIERVRRGDGTTTWYSTTKVLLFDSQGRVAGTLGVSRDITELKRAEEELQAAKSVAEAANRAKSEFLANMSHEIRTPMNGILGMTELTLESDLTQEQRDYLETVKSSAEALLTVINDILDYSKIEAGKLDLDLIPFDLRDSMDESIKLLALRAHQKGLELACDVERDVPQVVVGDPTRLRQIIVNLVGNAIKFTEKGEVVVSVARGSHAADRIELTFAVRDTGIGIPQSKQRIIFEAFTQADGSTTRDFGGTGLGLNISARLVGMMGGSIGVKSEVGKGSTFYFHARFGRAEPAELSAPQAVVALNGVRVLIVDDNATNRRIVEGILRHWNMTSTSVESAAAALRALRTARDAGAPFELVLTDIHMPEMDGFELTARIRENSNLAAATIMMLTSGGQRGDAARCRELGVAAYLTKPIRQSELRDAILRVLGRKASAGAELVTRHTLREETRGSPAAEGPRAKLRILLTEDNEVNQRLAVRLLEKAGHTVVVANNGREALAALERESFDVTLMDVQMPVMDGFEATAAIRERDKELGTHTTVIAMTAHAMKGDRDRCLAAGMDGYVTKPIRGKELYETLESCARPLAASRS